MSTLSCLFLLLLVKHCRLDQCMDSRRWCQSDGWCSRTTLALQLTLTLFACFSPRDCGRLFGFVKILAAPVSSSSIKCLAVLPGLTTALNGGCSFPNLAYEIKSAFMRNNVLDASFSLYPAPTVAEIPLRIPERINLGLKWLSPAGQLLTSFLFI